MSTQLIFLLLFFLPAQCCRAQPASPAAGSSNPPHYTESGNFYYRNYTIKEYCASFQNWAALQDKHGVMVFANGDGGPCGCSSDEDKGPDTRSLFVGTYSVEDISSSTGYVYYYDVTISNGAGGDLEISNFADLFNTPIKATVQGTTFSIKSQSFTNPSGKTITGQDRVQCRILETVKGIKNDWLSPQSSSREVALIPHLQYYFLETNMMSLPHTCPTLTLLPWGR